MATPTERLAIMAAVPKELEGLVLAMGSSMSVQKVAMRDFYLGEIAGQPCVVVLSRIGKVAAATTTTILIEKFNVTEIVFAGLAGGIHHSVQIGDIVVASSLMQHDLDARPLFDRYEVPMLGLSRFEPDPALSLALMTHSETYLEALTASGQVPSGQAVDVRPPRAHHGLIATGDIFVSDPAGGTEIHQRLPEVLCVEMEGSAMAQVCYEFGVPYAVMRVISDHANQDAKDHFTNFLEQWAGRYTCGVLRQFIASRVLYRPDGIQSMIDPAPLTPSGTPIGGS
ncbi:adenosylhomocysteine nucleosidase [Bordetella tumbae]|uniref:5'-methylthioadenosine/adenosylhomocysteine nucleosidase n=1 Tax=Bordetella tumbae TaxID=1649139 RepID=UPI0039F09A94